MDFKLIESSSPNMKIFFLLIWKRPLPWEEFQKLIIILEVKVGL